jgi:hypothetical protein
MTSMRIKWHGKVLPAIREIVKFGAVSTPVEVPACSLAYHGPSFRPSFRSRGRARACRIRQWEAG